MDDVAISFALILDKMTTKDTEGYEMSEKERVTISDIARLAGVGKSTVSRYLNNGSVSPQTRAKLDTVVKEYDYEPNRFAQSLKKTSSGMIGVVVPTFASFSLTEMMRGMDYVNQDDFFLTINTYHDVKRQVEAVKQLAHQNVDGIIVMTGKVTDELTAALEQVSVPVIVQGQPSTQFETVNVDNQHAGELLVPLIADAEPSEVLLLGVDPSIDYNVGQVRFDAVINALNGQMKRVYTSFDRTETITVMRDYLVTHELPKYIIAATDIIALGALAAVQEQDFNVPNDVKIVAFDNSPAAEIVTPASTTVGFDYFVLGQWLYRRLKDLFQPEPVLHDPMLAGTLVRRTSL